jgi:hypothetical protein
VNGVVRVLPLITKDPVTGKPLVVTRREGPQSGIVITGRFSLGWIGRLTPEQLDFVGQLVRYRGNIQRLAMELDVAYNTARNHLDEIVSALEQSSDMEDHEQAYEPTHEPYFETVPQPPDGDDSQEQVRRRAVLDSLDTGEISFEEAMRLLHAVSRHAGN